MRRHAVGRFTTRAQGFADSGERIRWSLFVGQCHSRIRDSMIPTGRTVLAVFVASGLAYPANGQDSSGVRLAFVASMGLAVPTGRLASRVAMAPTVYVGMAFHSVGSRTSLEVGESFASFAASHGDRTSIAVGAASVTRSIPIKRLLETYLRIGVGQSWLNVPADNGHDFVDVSHFGVAVLAGSGLRFGGRAGVLVSAQYMWLIHGGALMQLVPIEIGLSLR